MITFECNRHRIDLSGKPKLTLYEDEQYVFDTSEMWCFNSKTASCANTWRIRYSGSARTVVVSSNNEDSVVLQVVFR